MLRSGGILKSGVVSGQQWEGADLGSVGTEMGLRAQRKQNDLNTMCAEGKLGSECTAASRATGKELVLLTAIPHVPTSLKLSLCSRLRTQCQTWQVTWQVGVTQFPEVGGFLGGTLLEATVQCRSSYWEVMSCPWPRHRQRKDSGDFASHTANRTPGGYPLPLWGD